MSDHSAEDMEELVGDADMSEWVFFDDVPQQEKEGEKAVIEDLDQKENKTKDMINKTAMMIVGKLRDLPKGTFGTSSSRERQDDGSSPKVSQSRESSKTDSRESPKIINTKSTMDAVKSKPTSVVFEPDIGDIAGVIGNMDTDSIQLQKTISNVERDKKPSEGSKKRKPSDHYPQSQKIRKTDNNSEIVSTAEESKDEPFIKNKDNSTEAEEMKMKEMLVPVLPVLTEEDLKNIDLSVAEQMIESVRKEMAPSGGESFVVRFSPVELADLAEVSVQELIQSQPNMGFFFKRQGKFKKKKGCAEAYFNYSRDAQSFVQRLTHLKLVERCIEVTVTVLRNKKEAEVVSLTIALHKTKKLLELAKSKEDSSKAQEGMTNDSFQVGKVPVSATILTLWMLFPYSTQIVIPSEKENAESEPGFKGPVQVHFKNEKLMKAVLECCYDFKFSDYVLNIVQTHTEDDTIAKSDTESKRDIGVIQERRISAQEKPRQQTDFNKDEDNNKPQASPDQATSQDTSSTGDDDISSMTLDVCAGMLESLDKLKKLGTNNPNVLKILEMQTQLATLQKSLTQSNKDDSASSAEKESDPWTLGSSDLQGQKAAQEGKLSKEEKRKQEVEQRADRQRKEMEDLQKIEEADEAEKQREERDKRMRENELQRMREIEERRKANWAKKMIEDVKKNEEMLSRDNPANREEAQRLLKAVEDKQLEAKRLEEEKQKSEELARIAEEEKKRVENLEAMKKEIKEELASLDQSCEVSDVQKPEKSTGKSEAVKSDSVPVYSEKEYNKMCSRRQTLPENYQIQVSYYMNRQCPAAGCPSTKFFKTEDSFIDHWEIFHKPNVTVRFCQHCSAYFMNVPELESHLIKRHSLNDSDAVKKLLAEARVKVVSNPSFRDPGRYLPPLAS